jgi:hypothetical protein
MDAGQRQAHFGYSDRHCGIVSGLRLVMEQPSNHRYLGQSAGFEDTESSAVE